MSAAETIKIRIRSQSTETILQCAMLMGGGRLNQDQSLVRACLLDVYGEREGEEAQDALMDALGL